MSVALVDVSVARRAGIAQFGGPVVYSPAAGGAPFDVECVYIAPHQEIDLGAAAGVSTVQPSLSVMLDSFSSPPLAGDTLTRKSPTEGPLYMPSGVYRVDDVQYASDGGARLVLHKTS